MPRKKQYKSVLESFSEELTNSFNDELDHNEFINCMEKTRIKESYYKVLANTTLKIYSKEKGERK